MIHLYSFFIRAYGFSISVASLFNKKAKKWKSGRKNWRSKLKALIEKDKNVIWFHAASLGEAEQGLPIIEKLKSKSPKTSVLLTFFSPSGFENFNPNPAVDYVFYLPLDTKQNAKDFVSIVQPKLAVFIKYEIWVHFYNQLYKNNIPNLLAPALFRDNQIYFKPLARNFFLPVLKNLNHLFVQDHNSKQLLESFDVDNVSVCGETRLDRVIDLVNTPFDDPIIKNFCNNQKVLIIGSSWPLEEAILNKTLHLFPNLKVIIAPHHIDQDNIRRIQQEFAAFKICTYSDFDSSQNNCQILIIDNIGLLSRLYRYGDITFIGGGFGAGLHSTVEAAAYGLPVIFGPNHSSFIEPKEMITDGFGFEINTVEDFSTILTTLMSNQELLQNTSSKAKSYIQSKSGASTIISNHIEDLLE